MTPTGAALAEAVVWAVDSPRHACLRGLLWARAARRREREQGGDVAGWTAVVELLSRMLVTVAQWEREPLRRAFLGHDGRCAEPSVWVLTITREAPLSALVTCAPYDGRHRAKRWRCEPGREVA